MEPLSCITPNYLKEHDYAAEVYGCHVSIKRLTEDEIAKWTKRPDILVNNRNSNSKLSINNHSFNELSTNITAVDEQYGKAIVDGNRSKADNDKDEKDDNVLTDDDDESQDPNRTGLYYDDEIFTIDLGRVKRKQLRANEASGLPEKLLEKYGSIRRRNSSSLPLFCLFCLKEYYNVNQALLCYYRQTKHFPFKCVECEEVTLDTKDMIAHYQKFHPKSSTILYRRTYAPCKERWIRKFITYQLKCITNQAEMLPNNILHKYCPVCNQWDYKLGEMNTKIKTQHKLCSVLDKNHIHKHLKYHPFQCSLCLKQGIRFDLTIVNKKARQHLIQRHNFTDPTEEDLKENFEPLGMIPELERYINSYVKIVEESFEKDDECLTKSSSPSLTLTPSSRNHTTEQAASLNQLLASRSGSSPATSSTSSSRYSSSAVSKTPTASKPKGKIEVKVGKGSTGKANSKPLNPKSTSVKKKRLSSNDYSIDDFDYPMAKIPRKNGSSSLSRNGKRHLHKNMSPGIEDAVSIDLDSFYDNAPYGSKENEAPPIICIFCSDQLLDVLASWDHYANHLKYRPITCQLCQKTFPGPKAFQYHGSEHVDTDSLPYVWTHDDIIEPWGREFLNSLTKDHEAKPEFSAFCPVCCKKFPDQQLEMSITPLRIGVRAIRKHIFTHLKYSPYECNICNSGEKVFISDPEYDGAEHLAYHSINCSTQEISKYFTPSHAIEVLDIYLKDHFQKIKFLLDSHDDAGNPRSTTTTPPADLETEEETELSSSTIINGSSENLCDVESLFNSLSETFGANTFDNILDNVSHKNKKENEKMDVEETATATTATSISDNRTKPSLSSAKTSSSSSKVTKNISSASILSISTSSTDETTESNERSTIDTHETSLTDKT